MKTSNFIGTLLLCSIFCLAVQAQQAAIRKGAKVPDYKLVNLLNFKGKDPSLSDFHGKLLILEFWNSSCASCIEAFPKLIELQKQFNDKIQIILINPQQDVQEVKQIFERRRKLAGVNMTLPASCGDAGMRELFPHTTYPHVVWISPEGSVMSVTKGELVTRTNIKAILEGKNIQMPQKDQQRTAVDFSKPLFINGNGGNGEHLLGYAVFARYFPELRGDIDITPTYAIIANADIVSMFRFLFKDEPNRWGAQNWYPFGKTVLEVKQPEKLLRKIDGELQLQNIYTYQRIAGKALPIPRMKQLIIGDLKDYFQIDFRFEKRKRKCLVLTATDTSLIAYKSGDDHILVSDNKFEVNHYTVKEALEILVAITTYQVSPYPLIDETGLKGGLGNIQLEANIEDYQSLNQALKKYGLQFSLEDREVEVLVIVDAPES
jgi:thiol-disulfide isomerase/thioredoxin